MSTDKEHSKSGLWAGIFAYTWWGLFPVYFVLVKSVSAAEVLSHRIIWSVPFGLLILLFRRQIKETLTALKSPSKIFWLTLAAICLAANWGVYIWAIQINEIFQGSLGYYINPLLYVLVGVVFFGERLSRLQVFAVLLALTGVLILTFYGGEFPGISLFLAVSFTIYGVIRKQVDVGAMPGLFIETLILLIPGLLYIGWLTQSGNFAFLQASPDLKFLLMLAGPVTVIPLLAFAVAARQISLSMLGFLQFFGPTLQFFCGLYYGEPFTRAHALCFGFIWLAVIIFMINVWHKHSLENKAKA